MTHSTPHYDILAPRSKFYQGPFGRLCPGLPAWEPTLPPGTDLDAFFLDIANDQMIEKPGAEPADIAADPRDLERAFSSTIPAGYTYFGQFIDHDITFDPASSLMRRNDPNGLLNFRTPRLDLDNVYGRGPADQPYLYDNSTGNEGKLLTGLVPGSRLRDLPRNAQGTAIIGDMRNDENAMVSQLQLAFLLAHNTLVDRAKAAGRADPFAAARRTLHWLYHHIVWHDFVARIADPQTHKCALQLTKTCDGRVRWACGLDDVYSWRHQPFMPVEFSVAAYRFGHSMVRNSYQTNHPFRGAGRFAPIFDNTGPADPDDLRGFRPMKPENVIQWDWFLPMTSSRGRFPQLARKIDTKLANALFFLHENGPGSPINVLAYRNLKRGWTFGLPAGTDVAKKYCLKPVKLAKGEPDSLWFYILKEAGQGGGNRLGKLGSAIVCAVFAGLLKSDPCSWFTMEPCWKPDDDPLLCPGQDNVDDKAWTLASIIRLAGLPVDVGDVAEQADGNYPDTRCRGRAKAKGKAGVKAKAKARPKTARRKARE